MHRFKVRPCWKATPRFIPKIGGKPTMWKIRIRTVHLTLLAFPFICSAALTYVDATLLPPSYGTDSPYSMTTQAIPDPSYPGQNILVFEPSGATGKLPVIFFAHGFGPNHWQAYNDLLRHIVSLGNIVVYAPYPMFGATNDNRYMDMMIGFLSAAAYFGNDMDLTRVGFIGHSYGGGSLPAIAYCGLVQNGWGKQGAFMMLLAPWYSYQITDDELRQLPANLVTMDEIYDQDTVNDHRMAIDIYDHTPVAAGKYFLLVRSGSTNGQNLIADHSTPGRNPSPLLKRLAVFTPLDALIDLAFNQSPQAKAALSAMGSPGQTGAYQSLLAESQPAPDSPESNYLFSWDNSDNPRRSEESWK